ncbi:TPA: MFS transporter [Enterococcus faecium]|uniref:Major facilitator superfamily associated domain-containing protein n=2 Tax=Enterococcus faecium TaxID=1352 RepID=A0A3F3NQ89_ENTFC|nr:MFS transporter [Enterococcus faecium]EGP4917688.1 MFS transporter [Enterococcus faecium]EGP4991292.1 MFS transporter [Enterococcus faecium]EGP5745016.1 MFS transporter [Enterococcus faecium]EHG8746909.1 MFS transporter [Enterococcus faecium]ELZ1274362.1 MFS transporter [Enterococcus faecium]
MQRAQLFLFSIVSAMLIFQYEPLMFSKGVSSDISIKTLTAVQILIVVSVYLYRFLFKKYSKKNTIIRLSLILRIVVSLFMYATQSSGLFVVMFVLLQIVSTGLDIYFESSIMSWITAEKKDFGKYRMFGSLGYATSGFWISLFLVLLRNVSYMLLLACAINLVLLFSNITKPIPNTIEKITIEKIQGKKVPRIYYLFFAFCTLIITLPNSFGYILNSHLRNEYDLDLNKATFYASIAVFIGSCISEMFGFFAVDSVIRRFSPLKVVFIGFIFSGLRWFFALVSTSEEMFISTYLLHGISFAFIFIGSIHFIASVSDTIEMGELSMRFSFFANIMGIILAQLYSIMLPYIGTQGIIWVFLFVCIASFPMVILILRRQHNEILSN